MSLFGLFDRRTSIENPTVPLTSATLLEWLGVTEGDAGVRVTESTALKMSAVWRATAVIGGLCGALPLHVYASGTKNSVPSTLIDDPHPDMTPLEWKRLTGVHRCLWGNFYAQKVRDGAGRVQWLFPMNPDRVTPGKAQPIPENPSGKVFKVLADSGEEMAWTPREVFHVPGMGYDGVAGLSPVRHAAQGIGLALAAETYGAKLFGSGNLLSGFLKTTQRLDENQATALQARWRAKMSGIDRAHDVAVLDSGADFASLTMPNDDAQLLESRHFAVGEMGRYFGVPQFLMGETEKSTCIPGDVLVYTVDGPRKAADVRVGDKVWSLDFETKSFRPARVWRSEKTGHDPILNIRTRARALRCNAQHRVLVRRKHPSPRPGPGGYRAVEWRNEWIEAGQIKPGDYLVALNGLPDGKSDEAPNGRIVTPGFAAFAGLMLGDGTVSSGHVSVARHADAPYMPYYRGVIQAEFHRAATGGRLSYEQRERRTVTLREYERYTAFSSKAAVTELRELGLSGTARTKRVPEWVFGLRPDLIGEFLGGYIDSDGAVNARGWVTFSSCNEALLEDVRHLCMAIGVPIGTVRHYKSAGECVVAGRTVTRGDMYQLFAYDVRSNQKLTPHHPEKLRRIREATPSTREGVWSPGYVGRGPVGSRPGETFTIDGAALQLVKEITVEPAEDVFDLGVEGTHSFIANGVVVHNSWGTGLEQQMTGFVVIDLGPTWLAPLEQRVTKELLLPRGSRYAKYQVNGLLRGDSQARAEFYRTMRELGVFNADDIAELEDRPPLPDGLGQIFLQPMNFAPLGTKPDDGGTSDASQPAEQ